MFNLPSSCACCPTCPECPNPGVQSEALKLERQVVETRQRLLGEENNDTLRAMNNLAETYRLLKDPTNARKLHEHVLSTRNRLPGSEDDITP